MKRGLASNLTGSRGNDKRSSGTGAHLLRRPGIRARASPSCTRFSSIRPVTLWRSRREARARGELARAAGWRACARRLPALGLDPLQPQLLPALLAVGEPADARSDDERIAARVPWPIGRSTSSALPSRKTRNIPNPAAMSPPRSPKRSVTSASRDRPRRQAGAARAPHPASRDPGGGARDQRRAADDRPPPASGGARRARAQPGADRADRADQRAELAADRAPARA